MLTGSINLVEIYHVVTLMGFLQGLILVALLWRRRDQQGGIFLVFHLCMISLVMLFPLLTETFGLQYTWPLHVAVCFLFQGMFLYVRQFQRSTGWKDWMWHVILPAAILLPFAGWTYRSLNWSNGPEVENNPWVTLLSLIKIGLNLGYVLFTLWLLRRHRNLTHTVYSETSYVDLWWVSKLIAGFFVVILFGAGSYFIARFFQWPMELADMLTYTGFLVYLYYAYYFSVHQRPVIPLALAYAQAEFPPENQEEQPKKKYQRSTLTSEQAHAIYEKIQEVMAQKQLFQDPELTLLALAEATDAPTYHVSQVLSELAGANFYDFVNKYRVETAKRLLLDPSKKHYTVLAVAYESGFNSKTTFNKVFRKMTNQTPTEYLAEVQAKGK